MKQLLEQNRLWSSDQNVSLSPLPSSEAEGSLPTYLWIDCVDNYCTPHDLVGAAQDEIIVYKNLAHQVNYTDLNCLSVLQYAIQILNIKHVIVCGHYNCNLLRPSTQDISAALVEQWLNPVRDIHQKYEPWFAGDQSESQRLEKICELMVIEQVMQLCKTTVVQNAWERKQNLTIHGWAFSPDSGLLKNLIVDITGEQGIVPAYKAALLSCFGTSQV